MIAYLGDASAAAMRVRPVLLGREARPVASAITMMITISGTIYMGGVFGMWTAFYRGLGIGRSRKSSRSNRHVHRDDHSARRISGDHELAKLTMIGLAAQALVLLGTRVVPDWSV